MSVTASVLQANINQKLFTSSFNAYTASTETIFNTYTASTNSRLNNLESFSGSQLAKDATLQQLTSSVLAWTASTNTRLNIIETTYATTGSNTFRGTESIEGSLNITGSLGVSGSMVYSGSVRGQVFPITIASQTASMDCAKGNFFTLSLPAGATRLEATNIKPGETISLRILNETSASQCTGSTSVKFPTGFTYVPTNVSASTDIITFLTFDTGSIYAVAANYFA